MKPTPSIAGPDALFPLPLVPIETMMLYDDWPSYPMSCGAQFTFSGQLNFELFQTCVALASQRHPLMTTVVAPGGYHRWAWHLSGKIPSIEWLGANEPFAFARCEPFDLESEVGMRIWVQQQPAEVRLYFEFHHACCDGAGGLSYVEDVLTLYASGISSGAPDPNQLPPINPAMLLERGRFPQLATSLWGRCRALAADTLSAWELVGRTPAPLAHRGELTLPQRQSWRPYRFVSRHFGGKTLAALRAEAGNTGASLNDVLLRDLFQCLHQWNVQRSAGDGPLRVVVPVNLRSRADLAMPSTNRLSYSFVTRCPSQFTSSAALLDSIQNETTSARRSRGPAGLLAQLGLLQATRVAYPWILSEDRCYATAVFSNLGDPTRRFRNRFPRENGLVRVGNLLLTDFAGTTALRPQTHAGFFFNTYANQLTISTRFDPAYFTVSDALEFLDQLTDRFAGERPVSVSFQRSA